MSCVHIYIYVQWPNVCEKTTTVLPGLYVVYCVYICVLCLFVVYCVYVCVLCLYVRGGEFVRLEVFLDQVFPPRGSMFSSCKNRFLLALRLCRIG